MGTSRRYENIWGRPYVEHTDDNGKVIGTSWEYEDLLGRPYVEHRDENGRVTGTSRNYESIFGRPYVEHTDSDGKVIGTSRNYESIFGRPYIEHTDNSGKVIGTSRKYETIWGRPYIEHTGADGGSINRPVGPSTFSNTDIAGNSFASVLICAAACVVLELLYSFFQDFFFRHEQAFRLSAELAFPLLLLLIIRLSVRKADSESAWKMGIVTAALTAGCMFLTLEILRPMSVDYYQRWESNPESCREWLALGSGFLLFYADFLAFPLTAILYRGIIRHAAAEKRTELREVGCICLSLSSIANSIIFCVIDSALEFEGFSFFRALFPGLLLIVHAGLSSAIMLAASIAILTHEKKKTCC